MYRVRHPALRTTLWVFLLLGTLIRPMLVFSCEIHAALFAHADRPHVHDHAKAVDGSEPDDGHGVHESMQLGGAAAAVDLVSPFVFIGLRLGAQAIPGGVQSSLRAQYALAPFRPPIA